ncbi:hypothetical protein GCM10027073_72120 [Streptomyces chlorus]
MQEVLRQDVLDQESGGAGAQRVEDVFVQSGDPVGFLPARRHHDDRRAGAAPHPAADLDTVQAGQPQVQQHHIGLRDRCQRFPPGADAARPVPGPLQAQHQGGGDPRVVLDHQHKHTEIICFRHPCQD